MKKGIFGVSRTHFQSSAWEVSRIVPPLRRLYLAKFGKSRVRILLGRILMTADEHKVINLVGGAIIYNWRKVLFPHRSIHRFQIHRTFVNGKFGVLGVLRNVICVATEGGERKRNLTRIVKFLVKTFVERRRHLHRSHHHLNVAQRETASPRSITNTGDVWVFKWCLFRADTRVCVASAVGVCVAVPCAERRWSEGKNCI